MSQRSPLRRVSREVQIIPSQRPADHLLLMAKVPYILSMPQASSPSSTPAPWDRDALMRCVRRGERRAEFTQALHVSVAQDTPSLQELTSRSTADEFFEHVNSMLIEVCQQAHQGGRGEVAEQFHLEREQLFEQRRQLRLLLPEAD
eukprot:7581337-Pyramimonas_sp.AAC.1